jgi:hypothetical protein
MVAIDDKKKSFDELPYLGTMNTGQNGFGALY